MKYIPAEKLIADIERRKQIHKSNVENGFPDEANKITEDDNILSFIDFLQQEQPKGNLEYRLEHFGMPKENIDNCITQIAQGYGACRYLEGVQHGAEAVNELAKQEQPECVEKTARISPGLISNFGTSTYVLDVDLTQDEMAKLAPFGFNSGKIKIKIVCE